MKPSAWTLWLSGFGGAAAWSAAILVVPTLGSAACIASGGQTQRLGGMWWTMIILTGLAFLAGCYALAVTVRTLRAAENAGQPERTRFMAFGGLLMNVVFLLGLGFSAVGLVLSPVCR